MAKINISIHDDLLERLDDYCIRTFQSRSGVITRSVVQHLSYDDLNSSLIEISRSMKLISRSENISDNDKKKLQYIANLLQSFLESKILLEKLL